MYWFPELRIFERGAQQAAEFNYLEARNNYESAIAILKSNCNRTCCNSHADEPARDMGCLIIAMETILKAALILSNVSVAPGLQPRRTGFSHLYQKQAGYTLSRFKDDGRRRKMEEKLGPIVWVIEPERDDEKLGYLYDINHKMREMTDGAMNIFTAPQKQGDHLKRDSWSTAIVSHGICVYRSILRGLSTHDDIGCSLSRIYIIPGGIIWHGRSFDRVCDWYQDSDSGFVKANGLIDAQELDFQEVSLRM